MGQHAEPVFRRPHRLGGLRTGVCLVLAAGGCEPEGPDSGIRPGAPVTLRVDTVTVVHNDLFHRVESVRRLSDGGLAVMNQGSRNVLLLDSKGDSTGTIGRLGEGPGEFLAMTDLDTKGDSILVADAMARRVHLFHRTALVNMWSLREIAPTQVTFTPDGTPVVSATEEQPYPSSADAMPVLREKVQLYQIGDPVTAIKTPVDIPGKEYFVVFVAARGGWRHGIPAFGAYATYDLTRTGAIIADARSGRVVSVPWGGQAVRTLRPASPPPPVSGKELDRLRAIGDTVARGLPDRDDYLTYVREAVEVWGESVPRPFYSAVISDGSETLIRHYTSGTTDVSTWSLVAEDGETLGTFSLDRDTQLFSLEDREILGVGKDSLDVEHVIVGRIRDPS